LKAGVASIIPSGATYSLARANSSVHAASSQFRPAVIRLVGKESADIRAARFSGLPGSNQFALPIFFALARCAVFTQSWV